MINLFVSFLLLATPQTKFLTYTNPMNKFNMRYPERWQNQAGMNAVAFLSPKENEQDAFQENVNLMLQDLTQQPMNIDQYTELTRQQVVQFAGNDAIVSLKDATIGGQPCKEFVFKMAYDGRNLKLKQYWFIKEQTAYLFTYTAETTQYANYENVATNLMKSFSFY
ncbi:hypothetical protein [Dawidia soli]|uniref:DUF1795 domain-containing protein n=1 Tax=Dawidia soli TaxID=2782352 RepID=A0AAP2DCA2_9BACT|nr:hypothetical protein [Dawidia soli]MBT1688451.1 hypothetical protein [Dawidia soli]